MTTPKKGAATKTAEPKIDRLAPDLEDIVGDVKTGKFWVGMIPYSPERGLTVRPPKTSESLGPVTFPTYVTPWIGHEGVGAEDSPRARHMGAIVELNEAQLDELRDKLRRTVVRWRERDGAHAHGYLITFETEETIKGAQERWGLTPQQAQAYQAKVGRGNVRSTDVAFSKYIYCVRVDDEVDPDAGWRPSHKVPDSVYETGIDAL